MRSIIVEFVWEVKWFDGMCGVSGSSISSSFQKNDGVVEIENFVLGVNSNSGGRLDTSMSATIMSFSIRWLISLIENVLSPNRTLTESVIVCGVGLASRTITLRIIMVVFPGFHSGATMQCVLVLLTFVISHYS